jgi:hypothetical protein
MVKPMDTGSLLVMAVTLVLFVVALFTKGFSHDLLLEAGVFLVSVKLMLMAYKSSVASAMMQRQLDEIHRAVRQLGATTPLAPALQPTGRDEPASAESGPPRG